MDHDLNEASPHDLSVAEIAEYWTKGYVVVRGRFTPREVAGWQEACDTLWQTPGLVCEGNPIIEDRRTTEGGRILERINWITRLSEPLRALSRDPRLIVPARQLLEDDILLFKDKFTLRPSGACGYLMHQDFAYWEEFGVPADAIVTIAVAIDRCGTGNGAVEVFPHLHGSRLPAPAHEPRDVDETGIDLSTGELICLDAGDLLYFHSLVPHRSAANTSGGPRRMLFLNYNAARYGNLQEFVYQRTTMRA
jgi:ectoine hydroxylase-related dioxygenase (phytanoyl-CoA dioxygenase family)